MNKISVVLPCYNCEKTVVACLDSIAKQTYSNYEIIVVNDGSTDGTGKAIADFFSAHPQIPHTVIEQENGGISCARNTGITRATGEIIAFIDSDDCYDEKYLEVMEAHRQGDRLVVCGYYANKIKRLPNCPSRDLESQIRELRQSVCLNTVWNKLFSAEVLKKNGILFDKRLSYGEDLLFVMQYLDCVGEISIVDDALYFYRVTENGLNYSVHGDKPRELVDMWTSVFDFYTRHEYEKKELYQAFIKSVFSMLSNAFDPTNGIPKCERKQWFKQITDMVNESPMMQEETGKPGLVYRHLSKLLTQKRYRRISGVSAVVYRVRKQIHKSLFR